MFGCLASTTALTTQATTNSLTSLLKNQNPFSINNFSPINEDSLVIVFFILFQETRAFWKKLIQIVGESQVKLLKENLQKKLSARAQKNVKRTPWHLKNIVFLWGFFIFFLLLSISSYHRRGNLRVTSIHTMGLRAADDSSALKTKKAHQYPRKIGQC